MSVISAGSPTSDGETHPLPVHTVAVVTVCLGLVILSLVGTRFPTTLLAVGLAAAVAVVGLPHGGLDHRTGRALLRPHFGSRWSLPFLAGYFTVGASVILGWFVTPVVTIVGFFLLSAAHFGDTESGPRWRAMLFGGLPIWVPLVAQPAETLTLLAWVTPSGIDLADHLATLRPALIALAVVTVGVWAFGLVSGVRRGDREALLDAFRLAATAAMLAFAPVLIGFAVCFCGWHSLRELARLATRAEPLDPILGFRRVALAAAPLALAAAAVATGAAWYASTGREVGPVVVQAVFLGLSAVAVPHILLHAAADRAGVDPFAPEDREVTGAI